ncbi:MAG: toll/interleukin-1 receptor domain-containing protein, partial [Candidatus Limnocylindrales bacterium]
MAKLFLSYSRKDAQKAQRFTEWLETEGHDVWRDEDDIGGGASFSSEIENALNDCSAVLALWSADSVKSSWVRDEAGYGRDLGKLIPFSLDGTEPPLGFRQFQSIDLSKWKGRGEPPRADRIRGAIERICGNAASAAAAMRVASPPPRPLQRLSRTTLIAILLALMAAGVLGTFLWQRWSSDREIAIAVQASPASSDRVMAADYANVAAADMAAFLPRRFDRATVIGPADASGGTSGYRMEISTDPHGASVNAGLTLSDKKGHTTLWSKNWTVPTASAADLKAEVSAYASKAALCLTDAKGGGTRLSQPALGLYISGCTDIGDT